MSLIYFHRFLILCAILFGAYFAWVLWQRYSLNGHEDALWAAIGSAAVTVALAVYLPTVKGRKERS